MGPGLSSCSPPHDSSPSPLRKYDLYLRRLNQSKTSCGSSPKLRQSPLISHNTIGRASLKSRVAPRSTFISAPSTSIFTKSIVSGSTPPRSRSSAKAGTRKVLPPLRPSSARWARYIGLQPFFGQHHRFGPVLLSDGAVVRYDVPELEPRNVVDQAGVRRRDRLERVHPSFGPHEGAQQPGVDPDVRADVQSDVSGFDESIEDRHLGLAPVELPLLQLEGLVVLAHLPPTTCRP